MPDDDGRVDRPGGFHKVIKSRRAGAGVKVPACGEKLVFWVMRLNHLVATYS